MWLAIIKGE
ncbi:hypothetical protein YPPY02_3666, partial [Yersinia pestis PY-02]